MVVSFADTEFDRVWAMALAAQIKHGYLCFTKPYYNRARVISVSFSNEPDE